MNIVINAQSAGYGEEQGFCLQYGFIQCQYFDEPIRFGCIAFSKGVSDYDQIFFLRDKPLFQLHFTYRANP